jgi:predicted metal-dependent HD superfamily phosphohydrolase
MIASLHALVPQIEAFSRSIITALPAGYTYHCIEHTEMVVGYARILADAIPLTEDQSQLLIMAAWLHDVGFHTRYKGHEKESCRAAREKLGNELNAEAMASIEEAIMGTEIPQRAIHPIARALCDADLLYLGGDHFSVWSARLREEHLQVLGRSYTDREWIDYNIDFIRDHSFFTSFAREYYGEGLLKNLRALEAMKEKG